jgi:hypothetical protein
MALLSNTGPAARIRSRPVMCQHNLGLAQLANYLLLLAILD